MQGWDRRVAGGPHYIANRAVAQGQWPESGRPVMRGAQCLRGGKAGHAGRCHTERDLGGC